MDVHPFALLVGIMAFSAAILTAMWWDISTLVKEKNDGA